MKRFCERCGLDLVSGGLRIGGVRYNVHAKRCPTDKKATLSKTRLRWNGTFVPRHKTEFLPDWTVRNVQRV